MPTYAFQHPDTQVVIEVTQSMTEKHIYVDKNGLEWKRIWEANYQVGMITREK